MHWRQFLGLKPTEADLARELLQQAASAGDTGWIYDSDSSSLRSGARNINLANIHLEYAQATWLSRPSLLKKYREMIAPTNATEVAKLWTLARTRIFPLLRSRYEAMTFEIASRTEPSKAMPPRAAAPFLSNLDLIIGYDHGPTASHVTLDTMTIWGLPIEHVIDRARENLRALPSPRWQRAGDAVWKLESPGGYTESFLQLPKTFETLPTAGIPLVMIPNRGVLLATGSDVPNGLTELLALAKKSIQESPWPLCGGLFRVLPARIEPYTPVGGEAELLATLQRIDIASTYAAQQPALQAHHDALEDAVYVATYGIIGKKGAPNESQSWCSWTQGVPSLLPTTDSIAFIWDSDSARKSLLVSWQTAHSIVRHYFKPTTEDPPRTRVDDFPTPDELAQLKLQAETL